MLAAVLLWCTLIDSQKGCVQLTFCRPCWNPSIFPTLNSFSQPLCNHCATFYEKSYSSNKRKQHAFGSKNGAVIILAMHPRCSGVLQSMVAELRCWHGKRLLKRRWCLQRRTSDMIIAVTSRVSYRTTLMSLNTLAAALKHNWEAIRLRAEAKLRREVRNLRRKAGSKLGTSARQRSKPAQACH
eukprot:1136292-Pelagomonas_calceolata.AAC.4